MVGPGNMNNQSGTGVQAAAAQKGNPTGVEVPPPPGQVQSSKAASTAAPHMLGSEASAYQGTPRTVSQKSSEVLHQTSKTRASSPVRLVVGGFAVAMAMGYFTLYTKKKPEATAIDVAKVTTGNATPENTRGIRRN